MVTNKFHMPRSKLIFTEAFEHVEPHERAIKFSCVEASNGDPDTLERETLQTLAEWEKAEEVCRDENSTPPPSPPTHTHTNTKPSRTCS